MLCIHLGSITEDGLEVNEQVAATTFPLLDDLAQKEGILFVKPIEVRLQAFFAGESVRIGGRIASAVRLACSRCLTSFDLDITSEFSATAVPDLPVQLPDGPSDEIELVAHEMDVISYTGNSIDLRDEVSQQLITALPFNPLCKPECRGLCCRCGANLNHSACQCISADEGNPFAVLKGLSLPTKKD